jgi:hypothetical protein
MPSAIAAPAGVTASDTTAGCPTVRLVDPVTAPCVALIVAVPSPALVASPAPLITATVAAVLFHCAVPVKSWLLPSVYVPTAVYCSVVPNAMLAACGFTVIVTSAAALTVNVAPPLTVPTAIPIVLTPVPNPTLLASPCDPGLLLTVAAPAFDELQCPVCVTSCVVPSVYVPTAVYCCTVPNAMLTVAGVTAIDTSCAGVTFNTAHPVIPPEVALIVDVPTPTPLASPLLLIVADDWVPEFQLAVVLKSCVVPSVNVPVATNACVVPNAIVALPGVTAIDSSAAAVTVSVVVPCTAPELAVIVTVPVPALVASPWLPAVLLMLATDPVSELHSTVPVTSCVLPSVNVPVAENCCVVPSGITGIAGVTAIETSVAGFTVTVVVPLTVPIAAVTLVLPTPTLPATP